MSPEEIEALMRQAQPAEETVVRDFVAGYSSECDCGGTIEEGDKAGYIDGDTQASCWECCQEALH